MQTQVKMFRQIIKTGLENVNCIIEPKGSVGGVFLGDIVSTKKPELLEKHKINAILSCSIESKATVQHIETKYLPAHDNVNYDMKQHFDETSEWIKQRVEKGINVLVHCHAGISRSASVVIAYLIKQNGMLFEEALELVKSKRPRIKPNQAFLNQLHQYSSELKSPNPYQISRQTPWNQGKDYKEKEQQKLKQKENGKEKQRKQNEVSKNQKPIPNKGSQTCIEPFFVGNKQNVARPSNNFYSNQNALYNIQHNPYQIPNQKLSTHPNKNVNQHLFIKTLNTDQPPKSSRQVHQTPQTAYQVLKEVPQPHHLIRKSQQLRPLTSFSKGTQVMPRPSVQNRSKGIQLLHNLAATKP